MIRKNNIILPKWNEKRAKLQEGQIDPLTKTIKNRPFRALAEEYLEEGQLLCYFNIVDFKLFNYRFGFEEGDLLLVEMANILKTAFPDALITRMFADQFAVLLSNADCYDALIQVHEAFSNLDLPMALDFKVGIYSVSAKRNIINACDRAKTACDSIKKEREIFYRYYDEELSHLLLRQRFIVDNIELAMERGDIQVYYQPLIRALSKEVCGMEALVRWVDPHYGLLSPGEFIPVLEEYHLIHLLDIHVIEKICKAFYDIREQGESMVPVSFNVSRMDFELCDIFAELEALVEKYNVPKEMLTMEITETVLNKNPKLISNQIQKFHEAGYKVWMDDFGSGYSSLNILKDFDFDLLKIDMLLLRDFQEKSRKIVSSIVDMAKKIGIRTLAEGVETEEQLEFLREIGCEKLQGYYIGRPRPYDETIRHCKEMGFRFETPGKRQYNDDLGNVNLMSSYAHLTQYKGQDEEDCTEGIPLSIVEMVGDKLEFLYVNKSFAQELAVMNGLSVKQTEKIINDRKEVLYKVIRRFLTNLSEGDREVLDTMEGESFCSIRGREISHIPGRNAYIINLQVYQGNFLKLKQKKMMEKVKDLYKGFEEVLLWSPRLGKTEVLYERVKGENGAEKDALTEYAERTFSKEEGKRFFQFLRQSNVQKNKTAVKEKYFLGIDEKGKKIVLLVSLKASTLDGEGKVLVSVRRLWNESAASFIAGKMGEGL